MIVDYKMRWQRSICRRLRRRESAVSSVKSQWVHSTCQYPAEKHETSPCYNSAGCQAPDQTRTVGGVGSTGWIGVPISHTESNSSESGICFTSRCDVWVCALQLATYQQRKKSGLTIVLTHNNHWVLRALQVRVDDQPTYPRHMSTGLLAEVLTWVPLPAACQMVVNHEPNCFHFLLL